MIDFIILIYSGSQSQRPEPKPPKGFDISYEITGIESEKTAEDAARRSKTRRGQETENGRSFLQAEECLDDILN